MSQNTTTEYELKFVRIHSCVENWENSGFVESDRYELREYNKDRTDYEILRTFDSLDDLF